MAYLLTKSESRQLEKIKKSYYMQPILNLADKYINSKIKSENLLKNSFDKIYEFLLSAKPVVDQLLTERKQNGKIKNIEQARKSIAGNAFSQTIVYLFLKNKIAGHTWSFNKNFRHYC